VNGSREGQGAMSAAKRRRGWGLLFAVAIGAAGFAGCSSSSGAGSKSSTSTSTTSAVATTSTSATTGTTSTTRTSSSSTPPPIYEVSTGTVKGLGKVLVDGQGLTLYLFVPDKQSGNSTCYSECAEGWPPLLLPVGVTAPVAGPGINASLLGTTHRTDGTVEVTYNKWPLYTWQGDSTPGQASGQGLNNLGGLWYVLSPNGATIKTKP